MAYVRNFKALISGDRWNELSKLKTPVFVTYNFMSNAEVPTTAEYMPYYNTGYSSFTNPQKESFRKAAKVFEKAAGVRFVEVDKPGDAMIKVMNTDGSSWGGWANYGVGTAGYTSTGYLVIDNSGAYAPGSYGFETILHELGHAFGLKHPFDGDPILPKKLDNEDNTLMSYTSNHKGDTGLAPLDIDALQYLYGKSGGVAKGWDWSFSNRTHTFKLTGSNGNDKLVGTDTKTIISGKGGNDTILGRDLDDRASGDGGNDRFQLGSGNDRAFGGNGRDTFFDYWGDDLFDGGGGVDTVNFRESTWNVFVDLDAAGATGGIGSNTFRNVENAVGGAYADSISGSAAANRLVGGAGSDRLWGEAGNDVLVGGSGDDTLDGGAGDDVLDGGAGNDSLTGLSGNDEFRFRPNGNFDQVLDFVDGEDLIALLGFGYANRVGALGFFFEVGTAGDDRVGFSDQGTTVTIFGADLADISAADLIV